MVVLIAQVVRGVYVAAEAVMSLFPTRNCWFEGDVLCYAFFVFLFRELLSKGLHEPTPKLATHNLVALKGTDPEDP